MDKELGLFVKTLVRNQASSSLDGSLGRLNPTHTSSQVPVRNLSQREAANCLRILLRLDESVEVMEFRRQKHNQVSI
jgi:hypothetical protein